MRMFIYFTIENSRMRMAHGWVRVPEEPVREVDSYLFRGYGREGGIHGE